MYMRPVVKSFQSFRNLKWTPYANELEKQDIKNTLLIAKNE